jgi:OOP family OmpA-OmpF porin
VRYREISALVCVSLVTVSLSGCWGPAVTSAQDCRWTSVPSQDAKASVRTVVLVDRSGSYQQAGDGLERIVDAVVNISTDGFYRPGTRLVSIGAFDGSSTSVEWGVRNTAMPVARGTKSRLQARDRAAAESCLRDVVGPLMTEPAQLGSTDILGAFYAGNEQLPDDGAARKLVVFTDGLANTGCADLRSHQNARDLVEGCRAGNKLPRLAGIDVTLSGVGSPAVADQPLSTDQSRSLKDIWTALCRATGASGSQAAGSCVRDLAGAGGSVPEPSDDQGKPDPAVVIRVPQVRRQGPVIEISVPSDLLFAVDEDQLARVAKAKLRGLMARYAQKAPTKVTVVGHTDSSASAAYNIALSRRRAESVRKVLLKDGFRNISSSGKGESRPICAEIVHGKRDSDCMSRNRRVDILITTKVES